MDKFMAVKTKAIRAGTENGLTPYWASAGHIAVRSSMLEKPPRAGPTTNPRPNAMPMIAMPLERVWRVVTSATIAEAVAMFALMMPPSARERTSKAKESATIQIAYEIRMPTRETMRTCLRPILSESIPKKDVQKNCRRE